MFDLKLWDQKSHQERNNLCVLVFWAQWHPDSIALSEDFKGIDQNYKGNVLFYQINIDENKDAVSFYDIKTVPTVLFLKKDEILNSLSKSINREVIEDIIKRNL